MCYFLKKITALRFVYKVSKTKQLNRTRLLKEAGQKEKKKIPLVSCSGSLSSINRNKTKQKHTINTQTKTTHHEKGKISDHRNISCATRLIRICLFLISIRNKCNQGKLLTFTSKLLNDIKFQITTFSRAVLHRKQTTAYPTT